MRKALMVTPLALMALACGPFSGPPAGAPPCRAVPAARVYVSEGGSVQCSLPPNHRWVVVMPQGTRSVADMNAICISWRGVQFESFLTYAHCTL